jgi:hypothetical protein
MSSPHLGPARNITYALLAALTCSLALSAQADVYKWVDEKGQTHYSDLPPQTDSKLKATVLDPRPPAIAEPAPNATEKPSDKLSPRPVDAAAASAAAKAAAIRGKVLGVETVDNSPEAQRQRADNCERMHGEMSVLDGGKRVFTLDAKGERQYLDDDTRTARTAELQQLIATNCK